MPVYALSSHEQQALRDYRPKTELVEGIPKGCPVKQGSPRTEKNGQKNPTPLIGELLAPGKNDEEPA